MNQKTTIGLVIAFGLLALYVLLVQLPKDKAASEATSTPLPDNRLWSIGAEEINGGWIEAPAAGQRVAWSKDAQGIWAVTEPENRPADQVRTSNTTGQFANLFISRHLTETTDLTSFGVLNPAYKMGVRLGDGTVLEAAIGDKTPTGAGYYVLRSGENFAVVVSAGSIDSLLGLLEAPPYLMPTATPEPTDDPLATPPAAEATVGPEEAGTPAPAASPTP